MKIGGEYRADHLFPRHFEKLAKETGLGAPMVKRRVAEVAKAIKEALTNDALTTTAPEVAEIIDGRVGRFAG